MKRTTFGHIGYGLGLLPWACFLLAVATSSFRCLATFAILALPCGILGITLGWPALRDARRHPSGQSVLATNAEVPLGFLNLTAGALVAVIIYGLLT
jgi:hypothetical protein